MKKAIIVTTLILLTTGLAQAQRSSYKLGDKGAKGKSGSHKSSKKRGRDEGKKFNFSLGLSLATSNTVTTTFNDAQGTGTLTRSAAAFGIFAYPKYSFYVTEKYSISVGIPLTFAFAGSANSRTGSSASLMYDLPLMIDYNGGVMNPANRYGDSKFGYFGGVGIGIENCDATNYAFLGSYSGDYSSYDKAKSVGPNIHVGGVLRFGREDKPRFIGVRLSYKIGLNSDKFNYFTPSVFLNI